MVGLLNKEQTEHLITLCLGAIALVLGLISVYLFVNGVFTPYLDNPIIFIGLVFGTVLAIALGGVSVVLSIYDLNGAREGQIK